MNNTFHVRLTRRVTGDIPFCSPVAEPGTYEATHNPYGAVTLVMRAGERLGLRPGEFEFCDDAPKLLVELHKAMAQRKPEGEDPRLLQMCRAIVDRGYFICSTAYPEDCTRIIDHGKYACVQCLIESFGETAELATCRKCGCTDDNACPGGCSWVEPDLCSACAREVNS